ncbi:MAG: NAD(P)-dependent oxidoreductase [Acidimicrobiia bacterium]|nr:NAD(P)-dependent oxidoreductase [Acidimicrobiia bacterium]
MILVDNALAAREAAGHPIRLAMIGAGFMARGIANQLLSGRRGIRLSAVYARRLDQARDTLAYADPAIDPVVATTDADLERAIAAGRPAITDDPLLLCRAPQIDVVLDATGAVELGAQVALEAIRHGTHVVLMNAELDATLGPILQTYARSQGVVLSACDGDQPAVQLNLHRFVKGLGLTPRVLGNVKGLQDPYRTPETQKGFAERWGQRPSMVTSFADGSKISFEQTVVANATGFTVAKRGMFGWEHRAHVDALTTRYDLDLLRGLGGIVDYVVGALPAPGVFCLAEHDDPKQRHYLNLYKLGEGPLYSFYTPYHLCHFEVATTVGRVALFGDSAGSAAAGPVVEVCAVAKRDLQAGEVLDGYGRFMTYGEAVAASEHRRHGYLPEGLVEGCRLRRAVARDAVITFADVELPPGRLSDQLYEEQRSRFGGGTTAGPPASSPV